MAKRRPCLVVEAMSVAVGRGKVETKLRSYLATLDPRVGLETGAWHLEVLPLYPLGGSFDEDPALPEDDPIGFPRTARRNQLFFGEEVTALHVLFKMDHQLAAKEAREYGHRLYLQGKLPGYPPRQ